MYFKIPSRWHDYDGIKSGKSPQSWISMINQIWLKINLNQNKDATF